MSESAEHINHVKRIEKYVKSMLPGELCAHIVLDSPSSILQTPTMLCGAYRPDVYICHGNWHIIGEAKTDDDCIRKHSICQYKTYFEELQSLNIEESYLIICCGAFVSPTIFNLLLRMKRQNNYFAKVIIINELGEYRNF